MYGYVRVSCLNLLPYLSIRTLARTRQVVLPRTAQIATSSTEGTNPVGVAEGHAKQAIRKRRIDRMLIDQ